MAYLQKGAAVAPTFMPKGSSYNGKGRGYPDLAALAQFGIPLCDYGGCSGSGGTSASAPTVAGLLSLINDRRLAAGKPSLGFLNPRLYRLMADPAVYAECFTDVGVDKVGVPECWHRPAPMQQLRFTFDVTYLLFDAWSLSCLLACQPFSSPSHFS